MSGSFLGLPILLEPIKTRYNHKPYITMTTCVGSPRTETTPHRGSDRSHGENSLYNCMEFYRPSFTNLLSCTPSGHNQEKQNQTRRIVVKEIEEEEKKYDLWMKMKEEASIDVQQEPILSSYYFSSILSHNSLESALANHLSIKLSNSIIPVNTLFALFVGVFMEDEEIIGAIKDDLKAVKERDPACMSYVHCFLNFKGFLACQAHRAAHKLWLQGRKASALLIQNRISEVFAVDIHPGAKIGHGILLDHATGIVIGETVVIGNNVSILHNVTLGGTGKDAGDGHPKIGDGVLIGAGSNVLGNVRIGEGAKIGAGSVVLKEVPPRTTAVGSPARLVGGKANPVRLHHIPSLSMDHTSHVVEWSDYVI